MSLKGLIAAGAIVLAIAAAVLFFQRPQSFDVTKVEQTAPSAVIANDPPGDLAHQDVASVALKPESVRDSLESAESYGALLAQSMSFAESGDKEAAEVVAKVLKYCMFYNASPDKFDLHVSSLAELKPENAKALERISTKMKKRCVDVNGGQIIAAEDVEKWQIIASERGNVSSLIERAVASPGSVAPDESIALIEAAVRSDNPDAVRDAAYLLSSAKNSERAEISQIANHSFGSAAWEVAACRSGANCSNGSNFMDAICLSTSACNYASYEALVRSMMVPAGSTAEFERLVNSAQNEMRR